MRRTPCAIPVSCVILNSPMSPARRTCVPPHSSIEWSPIFITRTRSPYFSPNSATAPSLPARLAVEGRAVGDDLHALALARDLDPVALVVEHRQDARLLHGVRLVAEELRGPALLAQLLVDVRDRLLARPRELR